MKVVFVLWCVVFDVLLFGYWFGVIVVCVFVDLWVVCDMDVGGVMVWLLNGVYVSVDECVEC